ncbi:MAG: ribonuclease III [Calothrix sp. SM1_5_4]|nr:ribonuclease III [Calothrix sp. SM1_5_4]
MLEQRELEGLLGHQFTRPELLKVALTHRSYHFENKEKSPGHFERMEFLGDAVLDLVLSETLMDHYPSQNEGTLSKWRASLVNETSLSTLAREMCLEKYLYLGKSEDPQRDNPRPRLLASAFEAVLAALYLDAGLAAVRAFVERKFAERLTTLDASNEYGADFKTRLQEWTQKHHRTTPDYKVLESTGPEHAKIFRVEVGVSGEILGHGEGASRKSAEQDAARSALEKIFEGEKK